LAHQPGVDTRRQSQVAMRILGRGDDAAVRHTLSVKPFKMPAVVRQDRTTQRVRTCQNIRIRCTLPTILLNAQDVVSEPA
jgi:hypothetical protein